MGGGQERERKKKKNIMIKKKKNGSSTTKRINRLFLRCLEIRKLTYQLYHFFFYPTDRVGEKVWPAWFFLRFSLKSLRLLLSFQGSDLFKYNAALSDFVHTNLARLVTILRLRYHLVSRLHFSIDEEVVDVVVLRSAPGAALPQNGLVRLFISGNEIPSVWEFFRGAAV